MVVDVIFGSEPQRWTYKGTSDKVAPANTRIGVSASTPLIPATGVK